MPAARRIGAVLGLIALSLASPARASVGDDNVFFRLGVFAGYWTSGSLGELPDLAGIPTDGGDFHLEGAAAWGILAGFRLGGRFDLELLLDRSRTSVSPGGLEVWSTLLTLGPRYRFLSPGRDWYPFLGLGIGTQVLSPTRDLASRTWFTALLDGGAEFPVGDRFAVRLDLRILVTRVPGLGLDCPTPGDCPQGENTWMPQGDASGGFVFAF